MQKHGTFIDFVTGRADLLTVKIKPDTSESYGQFVTSLNALTEDKNTMEELKPFEHAFDKFL
ncbi:hypothetical protein ACQKL0_11855 [Peribacillus sp. NPDC097264]|uniref:hypothetical protein n=1 Tax=Peribacillus sp. NPDC097264 TaxID=3390616 RepID=UPI003D04246A